MSIYFSEPHDAEQQQPDEEVDERLKNIDPKMIELIKNEIMDCGSQVAWEDIAGLELAKSTIQVNCMMCYFSEIHF